MIIEELVLTHFRCVTYLKLDFSDLTVLLGANGSGKSTLISAIQYFYEPTAQISEDDFYNKDTTSPIIISVKYGNLRGEEREEFRNYIFDDILHVEKRISFEEDRFFQRYFAQTPQIPAFSDVRASSTKTELRQAFKTLGDSNEFDGLEMGAKSADEALERMAEYEKSHQELTTPIPMEEQFFGPANVGGGKLDHFTKFVRIPAVREISEEMDERKGSSFSELLELIVERRILQREDVREFKAKYQQDLQALFSLENLPELPDLGHQISELLQQYSPGSTLHLEWDDPVIPSINLPKAIPTMTEQGFQGSIENKGHGTQRALIVTLLHFLATVSRPDNEEQQLEEAEDNEKANPPITPDLILAIDEPELFLHPIRARYLSNLLDNLVEMTQHAQSNRNQIIYSTHSPYFVSLDRFDRIRRITKTVTKELPAPHSAAFLYTLDEARSQLAKISNVDPKKFSDASFIAHSYPVMTTIVNEGYFADMVVLVEGPGDAGLFWSIQDLLGMNWDSKGISIIPVGGKNSLDRPALIFTGLHIPVYIVFDGDISKKGTDNNEGNIATNHRLLALSGEKPEDYPSTSQRERCSIFQDKIEIEIRDHLGEELFNQIAQQVSKEMGYAQSSLLKNFRCSARFCQISYDKGHRLDFVEQSLNIVDSIWQRNSPQLNEL